MRDTLNQGLPALGLGTEAVPALEAFSALLLERNQVMNLTAITEPKDVAALHLLDSLALVGLAGLERQNVVDVGTGAGFPGVPLAIALPELRVTLLDSLGKRVNFLQESCGKLGLNNVRCIHGRAEEFALKHREGFDVAVSRAVAALPVLCELCLPFIKAGGKFLAMKSTNSDEELSQAAHAIKLLGGRVSAVEDYTIPGTEVTHRLIVIEKLAPTLKGYPRRWAKIQSAPL